MRFTALALAALSAGSAVAGYYPKELDHKDYFFQELSIHGAEKYRQCPSGKGFPIPQNPEKRKDLTEHEVCKYLGKFADELERIYYEIEAVKSYGHGHDYKNKHGHEEVYHRGRSYEKIVEQIYLLEFQLDLFDTEIDLSSLDVCWDCAQESQIACCYRNYAEALIRVLIVLSEHVRRLDGENAKYIITAINSLRAADYTFVYELVRRMQCEEYEREIMKKEGAADGSTPHSIREAFALYVSTPYITGDDFKGPRCKDVSPIQHKEHRPYKKYRPEHFPRPCPSHDIPHSICPVEKPDCPFRPHKPHHPHKPFPTTKKPCPPKPTHGHGHGHGHHQPKPKPCPKPIFHIFGGEE